KSRVEVLTTLFSSMVDIETPQITLAEDIPRLRELVNSAQRLRDARSADVAALEQQQRLLRLQISQIRQQQQESAQFGVSVREVAGDYEEISRQLEEVTSQLSLARYQTGIASTMAGEWSRNLFEAEVALEGIRAATG